MIRLIAWLGPAGYFSLQLKRLPMKHSLHLCRDESSGKAGVMLVPGSLTSISSAHKATQVAVWDALVYVQGAVNLFPWHRSAVRVPGSRSVTEQR